MPDTRIAIGSFLRFLYAQAESDGHDSPLPLRTVAEALHLPMGLVVKISKYLEHQGLINFESGTVEITIEGMLHVEKATESQP